MTCGNRFAMRVCNRWLLGAAIIVASGLYTAQRERVRMR